MTGRNCSHQLGACRFEHDVRRLVACVSWSLNKASVRRCGRRGFKRHAYSFGVRDAHQLSRGAKDPALVVPPISQKDVRSRFPLVNVTPVGCARRTARGNESECYFNRGAQLANGVCEVGDVNSVAIVVLPNGANRAA